MPSKMSSTQPPELSERGAATDPGAPSELSEIARRVAQITAQNNQLFRRLIEGEQRFRGLAKAVWKVQEEERRRLARELHDGIGQTLTALINQLQRVRQRGAGELDGGLAEALDIAGLALQDVRELSRLLRPPVLDDLGLRAGLTWLARTLREHTGLQTAIDWQEEGDERLDPDLETLVFRIVQEGLNNVVKHSGQREARLVVRRAGSRLEIEITDQGRGFDPAQVLSPAGGATGLGLRGIRDRIDLFGGRLELDAAPERGCRLRVFIPMSETRR